MPSVWFIRSHYAISTTNDLQLTVSLPNTMYNISHQTTHMRCIIPLKKILKECLLNHTQVKPSFNTLKMQSIFQTTPTAIMRLDAECLSVEMQYVRRMREKITQRSGNCYAEIPTLCPKICIANIEHAIWFIEVS